MCLVMKFSIGYNYIAIEYKVSYALQKPMSFSSFLPANKYLSTTICHLGPTMHGIFTKFSLDLSHYFLFPSPDWLRKVCEFITQQAWLKRQSARIFFTGLELTHIQSFSRSYVLLHRFCIPDHCEMTFKRVHSKKNSYLFSNLFSHLLSM